MANGTVQTQPVNLTDLSGTLPINRGGTGATTVWTAKNNLHHFRNATSGTSYTFDTPRVSQNDYSYFIMFGGTGAGVGSIFFYAGFVNTNTNGNTVVLAPVYPHGSLTFTGSYSDNQLTITVSGGTCWGGLRLIWMS